MGKLSIQPQPLAGLASFDGAVDVRTNSSPFLPRHAVELSAENQIAYHLPCDFAHSFQVLEPNSELLYLHTDFYSPEHEGGLRHDDPALAIVWPLPVADLSARDAGHPLIGSLIGQNRNFFGVII